MNRCKVCGSVTRILTEARALRDAYPDAGAMRRVPPSGVEVASVGGTPALRAALGCLQDEIDVVRAGRGGDIAVLADEIANVERLLRGV